MWGYIGWNIEIGWDKIFLVDQKYLQREQESVVWQFQQWEYPKKLNNDRVDRGVDNK